MKRMLVTGGAGFIGSHFVDLIAGRDGHEVTVIDKMTYAADPRNLDASRSQIRFIEGDITDPADLRRAFAGGMDRVVHFAAETHVDNSIEGPVVFAETNVIGTLRLLMFALEAGVERFVHVSTDEVYGPIREGAFAEDAPHRPSSPYAATKSGAEQLAWSYYVTHGLPVLITRSANNYGPRQHREKFLPKCILNALAGEPIPVYGTGQNQRDWLFVRDNCAAIETVLRHGKAGNAYNIGAQCFMPNVELAHKVVRMVGAPEELVTFVEDRKGHDFRYAVDAARIEGLGWGPATPFDEGLRETIEWYRTRSPAR